SYNSGGFNAGMFNTGSFNPGNTNTGSFNTGDLNTGWANSGDLNTGAFVSGDGNNGFFWRGDGQGLMEADYTLTIPAIPLTLGASGVLKLPITGNITGLSVEPFTIHGGGGAAIPLDARFTLLGHTSGTSVHVGIPDTDLGFTVHVPELPISILVDVEDSISPITTPRIRINTIDFHDFVVGGDTTSLVADVGGTVGGITVPVFHMSAEPGFGNTTDAPSSGFFNSGDGSASGFGNVGDRLSGFWNNASQASGFKNVGSLLSGLTNMGDSLSGIANTSVLGLASSGVGNSGENLSGVFFNGGLANLGVGNFGLADVGVGNVGVGNVGVGNVGFGNLGDFNFG
ncbi:pentapeptide repeat-containing protein, partial [Mycobacterium riyadhense]